MASGKITVEGKNIQLDPSLTHNEQEVVFTDDKLTLTLKSTAGTNKTFDLSENGVYLLNLQTDTLIGGIVNYGSIGMPGSIDGLKLAHYVAKKWPPVRLLLTSGHHTLKPTDLPSGARFCSKPVSPAAMTAVIAELLGEAPPQEPLH